MEETKYMVYIVENLRKQGALERLEAYGKQLQLANELTGVMNEMFHKYGADKTRDIIQNAHEMWKEEA